MRWPTIFGKRRAGDHLVAFQLFPQSFRRSLATARGNEHSKNSSPTTCGRSNEAVLRGGFSLAFEVRTQGSRDRTRSWLIENV